MTPSAPCICPWCWQRHKGCPVCGADTGCDDDGVEVCAGCMNEYDCELDDD